MTHKQPEVAARLLREAADELRQSHTLPHHRSDWTGEPEAKAAYDEYMDAADAVDALHAAIERKDALLRQALEAITYGCPPGCNDGMTDSGGTYPWGEAVLMPCPACETAKSITKELSQ